MKIANFKDKFEAIARSKTGFKAGDGAGQRRETVQRTLPKVAFGRDGRCYIPEARRGRGVGYNGKRQANRSDDKVFKSGIVYAVALEAPVWRHFADNHQGTTWSINTAKHPTYSPPTGVVEVTMDEQAELRMKGYQFKAYV